MGDEEVVERPVLHDILCEVLGSNHVYFEPPDGMSLVYPCIVYHYTNDLDTYADNIHYQSSKRYSVTIIDEDPDSKIPSRIKQLPYCSLDRNFVSDGLHHYVFTLFFSGSRIKEEIEDEQDQMGSDW